MLAQRTQLFATSGTAAARAAARRAADAGRSILDLSAGEILTPPPQSVCDAAVTAIQAGINRYTDTVGVEKLRAAIARKVAHETGLPWKADEIAVTAGAKQALFNTALVLLDPGDEVLILSPYWTTFPAQVRLAGATPIFVDTRATDYIPDPEALRAKITPATKAIVLNTPNNPTGAAYDDATLIAIANLALSANLWVIFDECYSDFAYEPAQHRNIVTLVPDIRSRTVIINAFSKSLAMTGWRLGYLAAPREVVNAVKALQSHTTSNPNTIAQHAVLAHLEQDDGSFRNALRQQLAHNRTRGLEILAQAAQVRVAPIGGGFYFYLDTAPLLDAAGCTIDELAGTILEHAGVACVPGSAFGDPYGLRFSFGVPAEQIEAGLPNVVAVLNELSATPRLPMEAVA